LKQYSNTTHFFFIIKYLYLNMCFMCDVFHVCVWLCWCAFVLLWAKLQPQHWIISLVALWSRIVWN